MAQNLRHVHAGADSARYRKQRFDGLRPADAAAGERLSCGYENFTLELKRSPFRLTFVYSQQTFSAIRC